MKVAVTDLSESTVSVQVGAAPEQAPLQPVKVEPEAGVAVRVSVVPAGRPAEHLAPQSICATGLVTVPAPLPAFVTVSVNVAGWTGAKVAVTDFAASIVTMHGPVPEQAPLQPVNVEPGSGVAVSVTSVPGANRAVQTLPQPIPVGVLATVPAPLPAFATVSAYCGVGGAFTLVVTLDELLAAFGSLVGEETVAVLERLPAAFVRTATEMACVLPLTITPKEHVSGEGPLQRGADAVIETTSTVLGRRSDKTTSAAVSGPWFVTVMV